MALARGTSPWLTAPLALALVGVFLIFSFGDILWLGIILLSVGLSVFLFLCYFFRDPERELGKGIISPADGVVTEVIQGPPFYVSIFMNVHNVHVNRMPVDGKVVSVEHISGGFVPAFNKDSDRNERFISSFSSEDGDFKIVQIAGTVARRILPYVKPGQELSRGERMGLIRLGSRVDLTMERDVSVKVKKGDRVLAGTTTLAMER